MFLLVLKKKVTLFESCPSSSLFLYLVFVALNKMASLPSCSYLLISHAFDSLKLRISHPIECPTFWIWLPSFLWGCRAGSSLPGNSYTKH